MNETLNRETLGRWVSQATDWVSNHVLVSATLTELAIILAAGTLAWILGRPLKRWFLAMQQKHSDYRLLHALWAGGARVAVPLVWLILQWIAIGAAASAGWRYSLITVTASLLSAWVIINVAAGVINNLTLRRIIAVTAWLAAALNIVGLLGPTITFLDRTGVKFGQAEITALAVLKGMLALALLLWLASIVSNVFESRIKAAPNLTPSVRVLLTKLFKITLVVMVVLVAISSVGIDITALAVFGGAIGVGIGFGLQKIVSNLISGLILLLDKSIKPGDVIAVADSYGRVDSLGARYVSVATRDGIEHLIPNEELIANRVENWSHSNILHRNRVQAGVHYQSDLHKAMKLCLEACAETARVLKDPAPNCLLRGFGDSSVDLELRYWINDPMAGVANVNSEILLKIWDKFHENDIEIPYPQRDLHIRTPAIQDLDEVANAVRGESEGA